MTYLFKVCRTLVLPKLYRFVDFVRLGIDLVVSAAVELPLYVVDGGATPKIVVLQRVAVVVVVSSAP